ncbi:hypothetical protein C482_20306 [Natrialba chahannaoensis JCM 10990]|uniref:Uncharacterized protein n=1 Tax=Natrialba chahannaoensis JCM 10990 TaxID=1227492 RepID=M0A3A0_9EURY|nr:hypothetical protein [Natrialba chahannaoensis]ELY93054.1 hypothetical protein C482_20306 [Natrialba chahannaoensis JCM 10990]
MSSLDSTDMITSHENIPDVTVDFLTPTSVWHVPAEDGPLIKSLNLDAFRTVCEFEETLDEIVTSDPADSEWVSSR